MIGSFPFGSTGLGGLANTSAASAQWSQSGKASIKKAATRSQSGISKIQAHTTRVQAGIAKIKKSTTRTQTGISQLRKGQIQTGKASIRNNAAQKTISGTAYIRSMRSARIILIMTQTHKHIKRDREHN